MKVLKLLGYALLALIIIVVGLGLMAPTSVYMERTISINAPQAVVFDAVNELKNWESWSPWQEQDPSTKTVYSETSAGAGAYYTWTSDNMGSGRMSITDVFNTDSLHTSVEFDGQGSATAGFRFTPKDGMTETTWTFYSDFPFPFNAMLLFQDFEAVLGKDYDRGLELLKQFAEAKSGAKPEYIIQEIEFPATRYLGKRSIVAMADMGTHFQQVMPEVGAAFADTKTAMTDDPAGLYYTWDEANQQSDLAIVIPAAPGTTIDGLTAIDIPASKALMIVYTGPYDGSIFAHEAMDAYIKANNLEMGYPVIEKYLADPGPETETDPAKWVTHIIYLLKE